VTGAQGATANGTNMYYGYAQNYGVAANGTATPQATDASAYYAYYPG
jgi:hypothetical protein